ncbi:MAG TPA: SDR family NAD(P)-dependent oxidoreductase, partial [Acidimicrobiia bacterium]|nr:SDR family NAD(P)-dependent oxidoreductase [Acidimicrobiia bacterium]
RLAEVLARLQDVSPSSRSWTVDLSDLDGIAAFARRASDELGGIDVLVNNAGVPKRRRVTDLTPDVVESVMALNYFSPVRLTLALLPELVERRGRVVNIGSIAARLGPPGEAAYAATKAALTAWSESMAVDLAGTGVAVHVVAPAVIDTELFHLPDNDPAMTEDVEALPVDAIVDPVLDLVETGGFERYVPEYFADIVIGKFQNPDAFMHGTIEYVKQRRSGVD